MTWSYWMRRPRNNRIGDISDEIEQQRKDAFASTKDDFQGNVQQLRHRITVATSFEQIKDAISDFGETPSDLSLDPTVLSQASKDGDFDEVRRQLLMGIEKWETEMLKWSEHDNYDTSTLAGHPMRTVAAGGNTFKRANGP